MISICMASFNGAKYIKQQIDSILCQIGDFDELIISDDGSTDGTLDILKSYDDSRIKILFHNKTYHKYSFGFTSSNFENAINYASGDIIFLSDQDDIWLPNKLKKMVDALKENLLVLSDCSIIDNDMNVIVESKFKYENIRKGFLNNIYKNGYLGCCVAFRSELKKSVLPFRKNVPHDMWIALIAESVGDVCFLDEVLLLYRRHDSNVSFTNNKLLSRQNSSSGIKFVPNTNSFLNKIGYRLITFFYVLRFKIFNV